MDNPKPEIQHHFRKDMGERSTWVMVNRFADPENPNEVFVLVPGIKGLSNITGMSVGIRIIECLFANSAHDT